MPSKPKPPEPRPTEPASPVVTYKLTGMSADRVDSDFFYVGPIPLDSLAGCPGSKSVSVTATEMSLIGYTDAGDVLWTTYSVDNNESVLADQDDFITVWIQ